MGLLEKIGKMAVCLVVEIWQNVEIYFWNIFNIRGRNENWSFICYLFRVNLYVIDIIRAKSKEPSMTVLDWVMETISIKMNDDRIIKL